MMFNQVALALNPDWHPVQTRLAQIYVQVGHGLTNQDDISGAVHAYLQALQLDPSLSHIHSLLRYNIMRYKLSKKDALRNKEQLLNDIVTVCRQTRALHPDCLFISITLGYALTQLGQQDAAIDCYQQTSEKIAQLCQPDPGLWQDAQRRSPDFIVIGAEKCGTTSLYHYLQCHPGMLLPLEKEIDFFDLEYDNGIDWYLAHFPPMPQQSGWVTGEVAPNYLYSADTPQRVFEHFPNIKLIVILRHPVDRTISRYNMLVKNGTEKRSFEEVISEEIDRIQGAMTTDDIPWTILDRCRYIGNSLYYYHLKHWLTIFPREQLFILKSETLFSQPKETVNELYQHLGLAPHTEQAYPQINMGSQAPVDDNLRQHLTHFFKPHTQKLENLTGRSFGW